MTSLSARLPSTVEEDEALVRSHPDTTTMTDDQAKAIIEAGHRLYLRHHWANKFDKEFDEAYTDDICGRRSLEWPRNCEKYCG